jgi:hypothetical protein
MGEDMNPVEIVNILIENDAEAFVSSLPDEFWDTFHVVYDGEGGVHARHGYRQHHMVYRDVGNGTRDFIGYIVQLGNHEWQPSGVAIPVTGKRTSVKKLDYKRVPSFGDQSRAVKYLMMIYRQRNGLTVDK